MWPLRWTSVAVLSTTAALALSSAAVLASDPVVAPLRGEPADPVAEEFREVCRRAKDSYQLYHGERRAREYRSRLDSDPTDGDERRSLERRLGWELLKLGRAEEAVALLDAGLDRATAPGAPPLGPEDHADWLQLSMLAHLQAAEDANCVGHHGSGNCIVPLRGEGLHRLPEHARRAGDRALERIRVQGGAGPTVVWLLNLARRLTGEGETVPPSLRLPAEAFTAGAAFPRWREVGSDLGLGGADLAGGAVMDDFDGDGRLDLVSSTSDPCGSLRALRNDGDGFTDVTAAWGLDGQLGGLNLTHADVDGDGRLDLLVLRGAWLHQEGRVRNSLLRNVAAEGAPRFEDVTRDAGLASPAYPTQTAAWADFDGDGDLDLYVGNESTDRGRAYPGQLFRNRGDGRFDDIAAAAGVQNGRLAKGVTWGDFDDDGDPDLFVSNIGPNRLYRNDGPVDEAPGGGVSGWRFTDVAAEAGVLGPDGRTFATWFFDMDNDGDLDLFVADYRSRIGDVVLPFFGRASETGQPWLYRNDGGRFTEVSRAFGLDRPQLPMGANFGDLDADGWPDVYLGTGEPKFEALMPNAMLRNVGGRRFEDVTFAGGFGHLQKGHGVAFGDVDGDGDEDVFHQVGGFFPGDAFANVLFENPGNGNRSVTLRLEGRRSNRFGVGARVEVKLVGKDGPRSVHALAGTGGSFGGNSHQLEIGVGDARGIEEIVVRWPAGGPPQRIRDTPPGAVLRIEEPAGVEGPAPGATPPETGD
ncbi:MAG: CRTAC1 family protein [Acidobacteriota bacterium]